MNIDMTVGKPSKILWRFSIPLLLSVVFQQAYNIADSIIAGRFAGDNALAAVGASYPITMLFMAVAAGMNIGASVVVSQLFGVRTYGRMKTAAGTSILFTGGLAIVLTVFGLLGARGLMLLLGTHPQILEAGVLYLRIYILGLLFLFVYNICTGIFTALGDSRTPLLFLIISSVGNIGLDLLFVIVFGWGVAGVAWATFIAQGVSALLSLITLLRRFRNISAADEPCAVFSAAMLGRVCGVAVPSIAQQSFISVGNLVVQYLVNSCGPDVIGGYAAAVKLNTLAIMAFTTMASGISAFTAQNIGAQKSERVSEGLRAGTQFSLLIALLFSALYFFFAEPLMGMFVPKGQDAAVIEAGRGFLRIVTPFYAVICLKLSADGVLRGSGAMTAFMIATFSDLILRVILAVIFCGFWQETGIWLSWPFGWVIGSALSVGFYWTGVWKKKVNT